uniref:Uncharacterized protein n=1 Tax=Corethron hystrix TaxID=216773 RepID=A0A7S1B3U6_9STRA
MLPKTLKNPPYHKCISHFSNPEQHTTIHHHEPTNINHDYILNKALQHSPTTKQEATLQLPFNFDFAIVSFPLMFLQKSPPINSRHNTHKNTKTYAQKSVTQ